MRKLRGDKGGQNLTLGTIILIVLGIAVLVFLIFGFSSGWSNLWSKITGLTSEANVEDKIKDCQTDCTLGETTAYCNEKKELRFFNNKGKKVEVKATCKEFADLKFTVEGKVSEGQIAKMGFEGCPGVTCTT